MLQFEVDQEYPETAILSSAMDQFEWRMGIPIR